MLAVSIPARADFTGKVAAKADGDMIILLTGLEIGLYAIPLADINRIMFRILSFPRAGERRGSRKPHQSAFAPESLTTFDHLVISERT